MHLGSCLTGTMNWIISLEGMRSHAHRSQADMSGLVE